MTDHDALLSAILDAPDDDTPRLVYADWCDENGEEQRAEFVRVQCEWAGATNPPFPECSEFAVNMRPGDKCGRCSVCRLASRERELVLHARSWVSTPLHEKAIAVGGNTVWSSGWDLTFRRGFIDSVTCSPADFLQHGPLIMAAHPIAEVRFPGFRVEITRHAEGWRSHVTYAAPVPVSITRNRARRSEMVARLMSDVRDLHEQDATAERNRREFFPGLFA